MSDKSQRVIDQIHNELAYYRWRLDKTKGRFYSQAFRLQNLPAKLRASNPDVREGMKASHELGQSIAELEDDLARMTAEVSKID
ncbi:MAG TPA: hypothetical protein VI953_02725 [Candidatus Paceibacterota bacterium]